MHRLCKDRKPKRRKSHSGGRSGYVLKAAVIFLTLTLRASADTAKVLIDSLPLKGSPFSQEKIASLSNGTVLPCNALLSHYALLGSGWADSDFLSISSNETFYSLGNVTVKVIEVSKKTDAVAPDGSKVSLYPPQYFFPISVQSDIVCFHYYNQTLCSDSLKVKRKSAEFGFLKSPVLIDGIVFKAGSAAYRFPNGQLGINDVIGYPSVPPKPYVDIGSIVQKVNLVISAFNQARESSPLTERLGYYPKVLNLSGKDIKLLSYENGVGAYVKLRYVFTDRNGKSILDRKTRLILKISNEKFWQDVAFFILKNSPLRFVQLDILRFVPGRGYQKVGFVAVGKSSFKNLCSLKAERFMKVTPSKISEDAWFFADDVYKRLESQNSQSLP